MDGGLDMQNVNDLLNKYMLSDQYLSLSINQKHHLKNYFNEYKTNYSTNNANLIELSNKYYNKLDNLQAIYTDRHQKSKLLYDDQMTYNQKYYDDYLENYRKFYNDELTKIYQSMDNVNIKFDDELRQLTNNYKDKFSSIINQKEKQKINVSYNVFLNDAENIHKYKNQQIDDIKLKETTFRNKANKDISIRNEKHESFLKNNEIEFAKKTKKTKIEKINIEKQIYNLKIELNDKIDDTINKNNITKTVSSITFSTENESLTEEKNQLSNKYQDNKYNILSKFKQNLENTDILLEISKNHFTGKEKKYQNDIKLLNKLKKDYNFEQEKLKSQKPFFEFSKNLNINIQDKYQAIEMEKIEYKIKKLHVEESSFNKDSNLLLDFDISKIKNEFLKTESILNKHIDLKKNNLHRIEVINKYLLTSTEEKNNILVSSLKFQCSHQQKLFTLLLDQINVNAMLDIEKNRLLSNYNQENIRFNISSSNERIKILTDDELTNKNILNAHKNLSLAILSQEIKKLNTTREYNKKIKENELANTNEILELSLACEKKQQENHIYEERFLHEKQIIQLYFNYCIRNINLFHKLIKTIYSSSTFSIISELYDLLINSCVDYINKIILIVEDQEKFEFGFNKDIELNLLINQEKHLKNEMLSKNDFINKTINNYQNTIMRYNDSIDDLQLSKSILINDYKSLNKSNKDYKNSKIKFKDAINQKNKETKNLYNKIEKNNNNINDLLKSKNKSNQKVLNKLKDIDDNAKKVHVTYEYDTKIFNLLKIQLNSLIEKIKTINTFDSIEDLDTVTNNLNLILNLFNNCYKNYINSFYSKISLRNKLLVNKTTKIYEKRKKALNKSSSLNYKNLNLELTDNLLLIEDRINELSVSNNKLINNYTDNLSKLNEDKKMIIIENKKQQNFNLSNFYFNLQVINENQKKYNFDTDKTANELKHDIYLSKKNISSQINKINNIYNKFISDEKKENYKLIKNIDSLYRKQIKEINNNLLILNKNYLLNKNKEIINKNKINKLNLAQLNAHTAKIQHEISLLFRSEKNFEKLALKRTK